MQVMEFTDSFRQGREPMQDFQELKVWQKAHASVLRIYAVSTQLPQSENLGLTANLRRTAITIARSIAEGAGRDSNAEFANDLRRARVASNELEYLLLLCRDLGFIAEPSYLELRDQVSEVGKMISGLLLRVVAAVGKVL